MWGRGDILNAQVYHGLSCVYGVVLHVIEHKNTLEHTTSDKNKAFLTTMNFGNADFSKHKRRGPQVHLTKISSTEERRPWAIKLPWCNYLMLVLALANGKGIKREIIRPSTQEMHREIARFWGHKIGKHKLETACFLVKGAKKPIRTCK